MNWRRIRNAAVACVLASGAFGVGTAHADDIAKDCKEATSGTSVSQGACMSLVRSGNATALLSGVCADPDAQAALDTTNRGQCLKVAKAGVR